MAYDVIRIENDGDSFPATPLTVIEQQVFDRVYDALIARIVTTVEQSMSRPFRAVADDMGAVSDYDVTDPKQLPTVSAERRVRFPSSRVAELFQQRKMHARWAVMIAKNLLNNNIFKGAHGGGSELVIRPLLPWDVLRMGTATEILCLSWDNFKSPTGNSTITSQGAAWNAINGTALSGQNYASDYWMGYGTTPNQTAATMDKRVLCVIFGFAELSAIRSVNAVQFKINTTTYSPTVLTYESVLAPTDYRVPIVASRTYIIPPRASFSSWVTAAYATPANLMPLGFAIGEANYINLLGTVATSTVPQT